MKSLYIMGTFGSGKTAVCVGLVQKLIERGKKVAYFKPVGTRGALHNEDEDALLMKSLLGMDASPAEISPFKTSPFYLTRYERGPDYRGQVLEAFHKIGDDADVVLVEGITSPQVMAGLGLDPASLAREMGSKILTVNRVRNDFSLDAILLLNELLTLKGLEVIGTIFNFVRRPVLDKARGVYKPILEEAGFDVIGIIPEDLELSSPTVAEYYDILGGELLAGEDHLDRIVEDVLVGAMTLDSALRFFRRSANKIVITGGDRADLALAALETNTSALVLTGGLYPNVKVIATADQKGVPVIMVHHDTYTTIELTHEVSRKIHPDDQKAIKMAKDTLEAYCDYERILAALE